MSISIAFKKKYSQSLYYCGALQHKIRKSAANYFYILMYHRINDSQNNREYIEPGMYVEPNTFKMHLETITSFFSIISLNEIIKIINNQQQVDFPKPLCAFTFDDGWIDFYQNAFPLLKSFNVPATVFLPTKFIGTDLWFWTDRLAFLWKNKKNDIKIGSNAIIKKLLEIKGPFQMQIEKALALLKTLPLEEIENNLSELENSWGIGSEKRGRAFLNWQEVKEMHDTGLISFGSHTAGHYILTTLGENEVRRELRLSMQRLLDEKVAKEGMIPFCYPNGNYSNNIARIVKEEGYACAMTAKRGWNNFSADTFRLFRTGMHQDISSIKPLFLGNIAGIV